MDTKPPIFKEATEALEADEWDQHHGIEVPRAEDD
jgi:hypothetical protein